MEDITTITLSKTTKDRLENFGKKSETFDELINRLLDETQKEGAA